VDKEAYFVVRFWVPPGNTEVLDWLDARHMAEVAAQPGFRWARRLRLEQDAEDGWHAHLMIYGVESRAALERYFTSSARQRFAEEAKAFAKVLRTERSWGTVEKTVTGVSSP
jgi:quinol monooxygenase YgiN